MKLQALFTVEYNVPVSGAVQRRIRVRQRPISPAMPRVTAAPAARSGRTALPQAVWLGGVGLACAMVLVGLRLSPDDAGRQVETFAPPHSAQALQVVQTVSPPVVASPVAPVVEGSVAQVPVPDLVKERAQHAAVRDALMRWADAWSRRDVAGYLAAYSGDYSGQAGERSAWERERRSRIEARRHIRVDLSDIAIEGGDDMVRVTFLQSYRSDALQETTRKTLTLMRDGQDRWLIVRES